MRANYEGGNYGYGQAKQALFELLNDRYKAERELYNHYMNNLDELESALQEGEKKAEEFASTVMLRL